MRDDLERVDDVVIGEDQALAIGGRNVSAERSRYTSTASTRVAQALTEHPAVSASPETLRWAAPGSDFEQFNDSLREETESNPCRCPDCCKTKAAAAAGRNPG